MYTLEMNNLFLLFCCPKPWRQIWVWYIELVYSRVISFSRGKPTNKIRVLDDSASTVRDYLHWRANKTLTYISEANKWLYAGCDWSILYFFSYHQRRVSCHPGDLSRKCHLSHGSCESLKRGTRPPSSRYKTVQNIPSWVCDYFVSQQTELIQSETPPTSITGFICKETLSINEDVIFEQWCFPLFFHHDFVYLFIFWHKKIALFCWYLFIYWRKLSRNPKPDKRLPRRQTKKLLP